MVMGRLLSSVVSCQLLDVGFGVQTEIGGHIWCSMDAFIYMIRNSVRRPCGARRTSVGKGDSEHAGLRRTSRLDQRARSMGCSPPTRLRLRPTPFSVRALVVHDEYFAGCSHGFAIR